MTDNRRVKAVYWEVDFMSVSVSGSVSSIKDVTIATTGKGEPNWSYIPSAGKSNKLKLPTPFGALSLEKSIL